MPFTVAAPFRVPARARRAPRTVGRGIPRLPFACRAARMCGRAATRRSTSSSSHARASFTSSARASRFRPRRASAAIQNAPDHRPDAAVVVLPRGVLPMARHVRAPQRALLADRPHDGLHRIRLVHARASSALSVRRHALASARRTAPRASCRTHRPRRRRTRSSRSSSTGRDCARFSSTYSLSSRARRYSASAAENGWNRPLKFARVAPRSACRRAASRDTRARSCTARSPSAA